MGPDGAPVCSTVAMPPSASITKTIRARRRAVVKVMTTADPPDYDQPWQTLGAETATGSGAIVKTPRGLRVLTNAHVVEGHVFIELRRYGDSQKYVAKVEGISHECDLALLTVEATEFFKGTRPFVLGSLPGLGDPVTVLGFPIGGDRLSITEGVVSRIDMTPYTQSERDLLTVQIDAAINAGNSGGPVVRSGRLVGIAFQALEEAEDIGYVIPTPIVKHFLDDIEDGAVDGFPSLGISTQDLESGAHRKALGLPRTQSGVLITHVEYEGSAWRDLEVGDVLLEVEGTAVASDGTVAFMTGARIEYEHLAVMHQLGDTLRVKVWRAGKRQTVELTLRAPSPLVKDPGPDAKPRFYIFGGLLFVPLTRAYLETWGEDWRSKAPASLVALHDDGTRSARCHEVVVVQKVLADKSNRGYHDLESVQIVRAQDHGVRSLRALVRIVESATDEDTYIRLLASDGTQIVIDRALALERQDTILKRYGVPQDRSDDLRTVRRRPARKKKAT